MYRTIASMGAMLALLLVTTSAGFGASRKCEVTGLPRPQCCASKASLMPPCCQKGCSTAGQVLR